MPNEFEDPDEVEVIAASTAFAATPTNAATTEATATDLASSGTTDPTQTEKSGFGSYPKSHCVQTSVSPNSPPTQAYPSSILACDDQPSPSLIFPSSHCSSPALIPSPTFVMH